MSLLKTTRDNIFYYHSTSSTNRKSISHSYDDHAHAYKISHHIDGKPPYLITNGDETFPIGDDELHVFKSSLDGASNEVAKYYCFLTDESVKKLSIGTIIIEATLVCSKELYDILYDSGYECYDYTDHARDFIICNEATYFITVPLISNDISKLDIHTCILTIEYIGNPILHISELPEFNETDETFNYTIVNEHIIKPRHNKLLNELIKYKKCHNMLSSACVPYNLALYKTLGASWNHELAVEAARLNNKALLYIPKEYITPSIITIALFAFPKLIFIIDDSLIPDSVLFIFMLTHPNMLNKVKKSIRNRLSNSKTHIDIVNLFNKTHQLLN